MKHRARKTLIAMINELGGLGLLNYEEHSKIKQRIDSRYNGAGWK